MLTLLTFPESFGAPSHSPFCAKAIGLLNLSGFAWQPEYLHDPRKMPLGRLPVLKTDERLIPDSANIQAYLESQGTDFYTGLSEDDKARAHALIRMTEEGLHYTLIYDRWLVDESWAHTRAAFFDTIPRLIRGPLTRSLRKKIRDKLNAQGTGQFCDMARLEFFKRDLNAISRQLGDKPFLFGPAPTAADAAIAPFLLMIQNLPVETGARKALREWDGIPAYIARCQRAFLHVGPQAQLSVAA